MTLRGGDARAAIGIVCRLGEPLSQHENDEMTANIGTALLFISFLAALYSAFAAVLGARLRIPELVVSARNAVVAVAVLVALAALTLMYAFVTHDFSLKYVVAQSTRSQPWPYLFSGFYGGQAGSLLYWSLTLALLSSIAVLIHFRTDRQLIPYVIATLMIIESFFLVVLNFISSPFETVSPVPPDGRGLNPLLQDPGMLVHPPMLLAGYMSVSIPFAFAIAALITGRVDSRWLQATRRWALLAWLFLSLGNLLGAWWAYHVLGWGGYWGWDPVENAAIMPWFAMSAYVHSVLVQERRGMLKVWNMVLIIVAFNLAIFGTFVVRSGILSSVHSFAVSEIGPYFFGFLAVSLIVSLTLLMLRLPQLRDEHNFDSLLSREATFLFNNLLFVSVILVTFLGVIFPLLSEAIQGRKINVGAPFYQQVNGPLLLAVVALMGLGMLVPWRRGAARALLRGLRTTLAVSALITVAAIVFGARSPWTIVSVAACTFAFVVALREFHRMALALMRAQQTMYPAALLAVFRYNRRRYGGYLVHVGVAIMGIAIVGSSFFQTERSVSLRPGQSVQVGQYTVAYQGLTTWREPGKQRTIASMLVRNANQSFEVAPQKVVYENWEDQPISEVVIKTVFPQLDDVYIVMAAFGQDGAASFHIFVNPLVAFLWLGGALLVVGGLISWWPSSTKSPKSAPQTVDARAGRLAPGKVST